MLLEIDFDLTRIQVHPEGIRHIQPNNRKQDWKPPGKSTIVKAAINQQQVLLTAANSK